MTHMPMIAQQNYLIPSEHEMMVFHTMAEQAVASKMYRGIGEKAGVMMIMLAAREMGISPMAALNGGLNIINGKVEISARMMSALVRRAGHSLETKEETDESVTVHGKRADNGNEQTVTFTLKDAQKAGLVKAGGGWTKFPKDMLFARALSRLARQLFSDVIGIGYVEGEIRESKVEKVVDRTEDLLTLDVPEPPICILEGDLMTLAETSDQEHIIKYAQAVQKHFNWEWHHTLMELLKDPEQTQKRFRIWKNNQSS